MAVEAKSRQANLRSEPQGERQERPQEALRAKIFDLLEAERVFSSAVFIGEKPTLEERRRVNDAYGVRLRQVGIDKITPENRFLAYQAMCPLATAEGMLRIMVRPRDVADAIALRAGRPLPALPGKPLAGGEKRDGSPVAYLLANCAEALRFPEAQRADAWFCADPLANLSNVTLRIGDRLKPMAAAHLALDELRSAAEHTARPDALLAALTQATGRSREAFATLRLRSEQLGRFAGAAAER